MLFIGEVERQRERDRAPIPCFTLQMLTVAFEREGATLTLESGNSAQFSPVGGMNPVT